MTNPSLPEDWEELIAGYVLDNLNVEEAEEFERLLKANPELTTEVNRFQELTAAMPYAAPVVEPPPHLRSAILKIAQTNKPQTNTHHLQRRNVWWGFGRLAAAVLLVTLLIDNYYLRRDVENAQAVIAKLEGQLRDARTVIATYKNAQPLLFALEGTGTATGASGSLVVSLNQPEAIVTIEDLPALPQGQAYRLWVLPEGGDPIYYGQFATNDQGRAIAKISTPNDLVPSEASQLLITSESANDPPIPKGPVVMHSVS
ncbi:MAG: anti-sigma factor [Coleofasciculaceae cyanobacterium]